MISNTTTSERADPAGFSSHIPVAMLAVFATLFALCPAASVQAQQGGPLATAYYAVTVQSNYGGIFEYIHEEDGVFPFFVSTGYVTGPFDSGFEVNASFTGGPSPIARVTGYGLPGSIGTTALGVAMARLSYVVRPTALPAYAPEISHLPVPINVSGVVSTRLLPLPGWVYGGFAEAIVDITTPGVSIEEFANVHLPNGYAQDSNTYSRTFSATANGLINVTLRARGNGTGYEFEAVADPLFEVDPDATFFFEGEEIRFADAIELEYSPGLEVPEPGMTALLLSGVAALGGLGRRPSRPGAS